MAEGGLNDLLVLPVLWFSVAKAAPKPGTGPWWKTPSQHLLVSTFSREMVFGLHSAVKSLRLWGAHTPSRGLLPIKLFHNHTELQKRRKCACLAFEVQLCRKRGQKRRTESKANRCQSRNAEARWGGDSPRFSSAKPGGKYFSGRILFSTSTPGFQRIFNSRPHLMVSANYLKWHWVKNSVLTSFAQPIRRQAFLNTRIQFWNPNIHIWQGENPNSRLRWPRFKHPFSFFPSEQNWPLPNWENN